MSTETLRAVRGLEDEIADRLADARSATAVVSRAQAEAQAVREAAAAEAEELGRRRIAELLAAAEESAAALRADGARRSAELRTVAEAAAGDDVADLLAAVLPPRPGTPPGTER
ncbi:hypothetical protein GCM10023328_19820 [Modestobacter marinus]|uniref:Vacuolar-type H+-ATPase subunit H n=1 Tax=Modestobacter marinus TaxID=477641 RepID=A0A846LD30_9ACTN|nr:hypothetical protein [Modestobacter marinus]NIH65567.1 vacuolar-type H+-ATPase subunit H [Modestobacter marinus]GGL65475.1 hypothetical protein GCM10011589_22030 [Modestobacter marinus]